MEKECKQNLKYITNGFRKCRNAFTAIGDETRQLILLVLLENFPLFCPKCRQETVINLKRENIEVVENYPTKELNI